jgi:hypothetical protein
MFSVKYIILRTGFEFINFYNQVEYSKIIYFPRDSIDI